MMDRGFPPTPRGYYAIAFSDEVKRGTVRTVRAFGRDHVVFRGESGRPSVVDAYCVHLGAHLGHGGRVVGDCIECPFHRWRWNGDGSCESIPNAKRIPPRARLPALEMQERDGLVFVRHGDTTTPTADVPHAAVLDDPAFEVLGRRTFTLRTHPQELIENIVDTAHFPVLHASAIPHLELAFDGTAMHVGFEAEPILAGRTRKGLPRVRVDITALGLSHVSVRTRYPGLAEIALLQYPIPTDGDLHTVRQIFVARVGRGPVAVFRRALAGIATIASIAASSRDFPIWNHKIYRPSPVLSDADGPIGRFRDWASQFYAGSVDERVPRGRRYRPSP